MPVSAAQYYLNPASGSDGNSGAINAPWKTMLKVRTTVAAGDIVYIRGGTYTPGQYKGETGTPQWKRTQSKGTAGNPITITNYPGETVIFNGQNTSWWMTWNPVTVTGAHVAYYVIIDGFEFRNFASAAVAVSGVDSSNRAENVTIQNCRFINFVDSNTGNMISKYARYVIYRNNYSFNIGDTSTGYNGSPDHAAYFTEYTYNSVYENNYSEKVAGYGFHGWFNHAQNDPGENIIVRKNTFVNQHGSGILFGGCQCANNYIYNNTIYMEAVPFPQQFADAGHSGLTNRVGNPTWNHFRIFNNIGYGHTTTAMVYLIRNLNISDMELDYNLWVNVNNTNRTFGWDDTPAPASATPTYYTLSGFQAATAYEDHSKSQDPLFTAPTSPTRDFTLQASSPALNAGRTLTQANGSGSNSTTLIVDDAGFFHDGYGMVTGDTIQIGTQQPVVVTAINYTTKTLTLASGRTWSDNTPVSLTYKGTAPDMGAYERDESTPDIGTELVAYWTFDENTGTTSADQTGRGHTATLANGSTWGSGLQGSAVILDGSNDTIFVADSEDFTFTSGFSIAVSFYATAIAANEVKLIGQWDDATQNNGAWELLLDGSGKLTLKVRTSGGNSVCTDTTTSFTFNTATWYQVVGTYDGGTSGNNCVLYVDGVQVHAGTLTTLPLNSAIQVGIGTVINITAGRTWNGRLDNIRLYKGRALTANDVAQLFVTVPPTEPPPGLPPVAGVGSRPAARGFFTLNLGY